MRRPRGLSGSDRSRRAPAAGLAAPGLVPGLALALALGLAAGPSSAARIGAMDGSFDLGEQALLTPAHGDLRVPSTLDVAGDEAAIPHADLLLEATAARARLLPEAARADLRPGAGQAGLWRLADPLGARTLVLSAEAAGGRMSAGIGGGLLLRLLGDAEGPLRLALRRMNDPLRAGMGLHASPLAVLSPQERAADEDLPPPEGFAIDPDALDRRAMLIGVGLLTLVLILGAVAYTFAPTGGTAPRRR